MLFRSDALDRIRGGRVTVVFRRWKKARVRAGTRLRTAIGLVEVRSVAQVPEVTPADVAPAGYPGIEALRSDIPGDPVAPLFRVEVAYAGADPRIALRADVLGLDEVAARLDRMDGGKRGPWTLAVLGLIAERPATRAGDLFAEAGYEDLASFKRDVRRLKELGLTESLEVGYRLSPRGERLLRAEHGEAAADGPDIKAVAAATYAATADHFDDPALSFWDRYGRRTVAQIGLRPGDRVLDACCGTGASALPAAHVVGAAGHVLGLDLAEPALVLARAKAQAQGLANTEFRAVDVMRAGLPPESFDAVVCVFGVFFLPDMTAAVAELWRLVRPGGVLAVTVWGPRFLEPATTAFLAAVRAERPDLTDIFQPWTRVTDEAALARLFQQAGAGTPTVAAEPGTQPLAGPEDWWTVVLGTGYRATVNQVGPAAARRVRAANIEWLRRHEVRELHTNVVYARSRKPGRQARSPARPS